MRFSTTDLIIEDVNEDILSEVGIKYREGAISYEYTKKCGEYLENLLENTYKQIEEIVLYIRISQEKYLRDLRLQGLIRAIYDRWAACASKNCNDILILPLLDDKVLKIESGSTRDILSIDKPIMFCGTFDRLHIGHKYTILCSFLLANSYLYLGVVTAPELANKKYPELIQSYSERVENIERYVKKISETTRMAISITLLDKYSELDRLKDNNVGMDVVIYPLEAALGPAEATESEFYLIVTEDSYKGGLAVNEARKKKGLPVWPLIQLPLVGDPTVCSTDMRNKLSHIQS